jgi:polar amino acid transport system permease protein
MTWFLFGLMVRAAGTTLLISLVAIAIGLVIGTLVCGAMLSPSALLRGPARLYVSFFRGVPLLVQLLLFYHLLPAIGINISSVAAALVALSLCTGAYQAENLRGGFLSVSRGLLEAAEAVGMQRFQCFRRVSAPIAIRLTIPALVNEAIGILHASALISVVGVIELTKTARNFAASTFDALPFYACAGLLYLGLTYLVLGVGRMAERRLAVRHA